MADRLLAVVRRRKPVTKSPAQSVDGKSLTRVLVVGFGPAGRQVVQTLVAQHLEPVIIDINPKNRDYARQLGLPLYLGDGSQEDILTHANLAEVCMVVVTIPDPNDAVQIVKMVRGLRPGVPIAVRCRYNRNVADLKEAGADIVVDEEISMGNMLSRQIVDYLKDDSGAVVACRLGGQTPELIDEMRPSPGF
jgi:CPA2 family monovalent cation:H+ antiporter-2